MQRPVCWLWGVGLVGLGLVGCAARPQAVDNPIRITAEEYHRVFDAAVKVLADRQFVVDRQDRRFGLVTSRPQIASSLLEPWRTDNSRPSQAVRATLNHERRRVAVHLDPAGSQPDRPAGENPPDTGPGRSGDYLMTVEVTVERRQVPQAQPSAASVTSLEFARGRSTAHGTLTETGYRQAFWRPVARDRAMEGRLILEILHRATADTGQADTPKAHSPSDGPVPSAEREGQPPAGTSGDCGDAGTGTPQAGGTDAGQTAQVRMPVS